MRTFIFCCCVLLSGCEVETEVQVNHRQLTKWERCLTGEFNLIGQREDCKAIALVRMAEKGCGLPAEVTP